MINSVSDRLNGSNLGWRFARQSNFPSIANLSMLIAAVRKFSGSTTASRTPCASAAAGLNALPVDIQVAALSKPIIRGNLTVPPKPGIKPNLTSGKPMLVFVSATR